MEEINSKTLITKKYIASHRRHDSIDFMRGVAIILMILDHSTAVFNIHPSLETPNYSHSQVIFSSFILRYITHIAPLTFFYLAGMSVNFAINNRILRGSTESEASYSWIIRGIFLIALQFFVVNPLCPWCDGYYFGVLSMVGFSLIIASLLRKIPNSYFLTIIILIFVIVQFTIKVNVDSILIDSSYIMQIFLTSSQSGKIKVMYPILPWLPIILLGCYHSKIDPLLKRFHLKQGLILSISLFLILALLRIYDCIGCFRIPLDNSLREIFATSKYPPSSCFLLFGLSQMYLALGILQAINAKLFWNNYISKVIKILGTNPLFSYAIHIVLVKLLRDLLKDFEINNPIINVILLTIITSTILSFLTYFYQRGKIKLRVFLYNLEEVIQNPKLKKIIKIISRNY